MAIDKAVDSAALDAQFTAIANAIRGKNGSTDTYTPAQMVTAISAIQTGIEPLSVEFDQIPAAVKSYLANVDYTNVTYEANTSLIARYVPNPLSGRLDQPIGAVVTLPTGTLVRNWYQQEINSGQNAIYNDVPLTNTPFTVVDSGIEAVGQIRPNGGSLRQIRCPQAVNVRDLGGWSCDGGTVKYGKLFRGGNVTAADRDVLVNQCGVRFELDLRGSSEAQGQTSSSLGEGVGYAVFDDYAWYSLSNTALWKQILRTLVDAVLADRPLYFHCAAGADRTGTLACVIEAMLGVSQSDIDKDYELTCFRSGVDTVAHARRRDETEWIGLMNQIDALTIGTTFRDKVLHWAASLGITQGEINAFRSMLISGAPQEVDLNLNTYTVTNALIHAEIDNAAASVTQYQPYAAVIRAEDGFVIETATVTMGGIDVTAAVLKNVYNSNGDVASVQIVIESVTGNIAIGVTAVSAAPAYTNLFDPSTAQLNYRFNSSNAAYANNGYFLTDYIPCDNSGGYKTLRVKGASFGTNSKIVWYNNSQSVISGYMKNTLNVQTDPAGVSTLKVGYYESTAGDPSTDHESASSALIRYIRLALYVKSGELTSSDIANVVITLDEPIT